MLPTLQSTVNSCQLKSLNYNSIITDNKFGEVVRLSRENSGADMKPGRHARDLNRFCWVSLSRSEINSLLLLGRLLNITKVSVRSIICSRSSKN